MRKNGLINFIFIIALPLFLLAVFLPEAYAQKEYKFGTLFPLTGRAAWIGDHFLEGINLAVEEINSKGGFDGMILRAVNEDHKANPKDGANAATKLVPKFCTQSEDDLKK
jgi:branched-chain amino acid transport system substrate-binding protein